MICCVPPVVRFAEVGATVTLATGIAVTVTVAVPDLPSLVAVMSDVPGATAVTVPSGVTVATPGVPDVHVMARPVRMLFCTSRVVAVRDPVPPT